MVRTGTAMTVDRPNRDALVDAIRRCLAGEITAFDLDDEIFRISESSPDPTIEYSAQALRSMYDDLQDDQLELSKEQSEFCQRLILLLQSGAYVEVQKRRQWSITQVFAGLAGLAFLACAGQLGPGYRLLALTLPFGLLSMAVAHLRRRRWSIKPDSGRVGLPPPSGVLELLAVRRRVGDFAKQQQPESFAGRPVRSAGANFIILLPLYAAWLILSPVALVLQMLPITETEPRIVTS